jgi:hypothetical protein
MKLNLSISLARPLIGIWIAALVSTATTPLRAEPFDPPGTDYANGSQEDDLAAVPMAPMESSDRGANLPAFVDLSARLPGPGNQGHAQSCTAWAVGYAARSYYTSAYEARNTHDLKNVPSPAFIYNMSWRRDKKPSCGGGSTFASAVEVLKQGAPSLADYPYHSSDCGAPPPATVARSTDFRVGGLHRLDKDSIDDVKGALARANPVLISFHDDAAWHNFRGAGVFDRGPLDVEKGWHSMALVGYDERKQAFRLINSWGKGWGDNGYAWVSYAVFRARVREAAILEVARPRVPVAVTPAPAPHAALPRPQLPPLVRPQPTSPARPLPSVVQAPPPAPVVQPRPPQRTPARVGEPGIGTVGRTIGEF